MKVAAFNDGLTSKHNLKCRLWASTSSHTPFFPVSAQVNVGDWTTVEVVAPTNVASAVFLWEEHAGGQILKKAITATIGSGPMNRDLVIAWANTDELIDVPVDFETCAAYSTAIQGVGRPATLLGSKDYATASSLSEARTSIQIELEPDGQSGARADRLTLWLHWSKRVEGSPLHRKACGSLWCSTDKAGNERYPVDLLSITVEMPNLFGGTETNTDAKSGHQVDGFCEAYGTSFTVPSFTAHYRLFMRHRGFKDWSRDDTQSL